MELSLFQIIEGVAKFALILVGCAFLFDYAFGGGKIVKGFHRMLQEGLMKSREKTKKRDFLASLDKGEIRRYYTVIQDMECVDDISYEEYKREVCTYLQYDMIQYVLDEHNKTLVCDIKDGVDEVLWRIKNHHLPDCDYSVQVTESKTESDHSWDHIVGIICGESVNFWTQGHAGCIYDVINPIISKKFGTQFICLPYTGDETSYVFLKNDIAEKVRRNPYFAQEEKIKEDAGYIPVKRNPSK